MRIVPESEWSRTYGGYQFTISDENITIKFNSQHFKILYKYLRIIKAVRVYINNDRSRNNARAINVNSQELFYYIKSGIKTYD